MRALERATMTPTHSMPRRDSGRAARTFVNPDRRPWQSRSSEPASPSCWRFSGLPADLLRSGRFGVSRSRMISCGSRIRNLEGRSGFDVDPNVGAGSGQTIFQCHIHLILRSKATLITSRRSSRITRGEFAPLDKLRDLAQRRSRRWSSPINRLLGLMTPVEPSWLTERRALIGRSPQRAVARRALAATDLSGGWR
jgi:hypothetical protein